MTERYLAFDVETPNRYNNRMSALAVSVVEGGAGRTDVCVAD